MFGYIKPKTSELKVCEYEFYRAVYCGLCRALGRRTVCFSSFTLSYDFVFLALVGFALDETSIDIKAHRCAAHPIKKRLMVEINNTLVTSAESSDLLTYYKVYDNWQDSRNIKKLLYKIPLCISKHTKNKIKNINESDIKIKKSLVHLNEIEKNLKKSLDEPAQAFGEILGVMFSYGRKNEICSRIAYEIGFHCGRWIYIVDAIDDLKEDIKNSSYNPLNADDSREILKNALTHELYCLEAAVNLIEFNDKGIENIIKNIIYLGMPDCSDKVLEKSILRV